MSQIRQIANLSYINNKSRFNKYVHKFIYLCQKHSVSYYVNDEDINIAFLLTLNEVLNAINNVAINHMNNPNTINNTSGAIASYIDIYDNIINNTKIKLLELDELTDVTKLVYADNMLDYTYDNIFTDGSDIMHSILPSPSNMIVLDNFNIIA